MANDLRDLAIRQLRDNGMSPEDATAILDSFAKGPGHDIPWTNTATFLTKPLVERIDRAAINWMMAHRLTGDPA